MRFLISFFLLISMHFGLYAQFGVGPIELVRLSVGEFEQEKLDNFKASKTIFIYRPSDDLDALKKAIEEVWTVTEISFVPYSEYFNQNLENTSIFSFGGINTNKRFVNSVGQPTTGMTWDNTHVYFHLWMPGKNKRGKDITLSFARVETHPTYADYDFLVKNIEDTGMDYVYNEANLKNWKTGFIKNYLKNVNDLLSNETERWLYQTETKSPELKKLRNQTLYIPDYAMVNFNKFTGDESKRHDEEKMFKKYPYKYEIIETDKLSKKILEDNEPFYYMSYVKSSTDQYVSIFNSKTGAMIYHKYSAASYNISNSDFKDLAGIIAKAK